MEPSKLANYLSERGARAYQADHEHKLHRRVSDRIERRILGSFFERLGPGATVLDVPSGTGRLLELLDRHADVVLAADISPSMLRLGAEREPAAARARLRCSALALPFAAASVDVVVSVRLSHHLDDHATRIAHLRELMRVARRAAILTFFDSDSLKNRWRRLRARWNGKRPKHALCRADVRAAAEGCGFAATRLVPVSRIGSGHVYALLERRG